MVVYDAQKFCVLLMSDLFYSAIFLSQWRLANVTQIPKSPPSSLSGVISTAQAVPNLCVS